MKRDKNAAAGTKAGSQLKANAVSLNQYADIIRD